MANPVFNSKNFQEQMHSGDGRGGAATRQAPGWYQGGQGSQQGQGWYQGGQQPQYGQQAPGPRSTPRSSWSRCTPSPPPAPPTPGG
ncbi:hypothetical protein [Citricoccus sp. CH26A]|uniref:hypothetical protein n=1 Tax=Citricoccus sp. CH26A TaxID=1045009 RepID=UPI000255F34E